MVLLDQFEGQTIVSHDKRLARPIKNDFKQKEKMQGKLVQAKEVEAQQSYKSTQD